LILMGGWCGLRPIPTSTTVRLRCIDLGVSYKNRLRCIDLGVSYKNHLPQDRAPLARDWQRHAYLTRAF
jgi:hypothetical protein